MQAENVEEYKLIREEMKSLKDCITTYVGWVLGGAGAGFLALGYAARDLEDHGVALAFSALSAGFVVSIVLLILMYKFISHNRYAGYCRLLTQERFDTPEDLRGKNLLGWEACVARQRIYDFRNQRLMDYARAIHIDGVSLNLKDIVRRVTGPRPEADRDNIRRGFRIVRRALSGHVTGTSWPFPVYVTSLFFVIVWLYVGLSLYIVLGTKAPRPTAHQWVVLGLGICCVGYLWLAFFGKILNLMQGSRSVRAFLLKLLLVRRWFLEELGVRNYRIVFCDHPEDVRDGDGPDL